MRMAELVLRSAAGKGIWFIESGGYVTPRGKNGTDIFRKTVNDPTTAEQKTVRVAVILGPRFQIKRPEAREALERESTKQNGQTCAASRVMNDGFVSFGWFVRNRFLPPKVANWKEETSKGVVTT